MLKKLEKMKHSLVPLETRVNLFVVSQEIHFARSAAHFPKEHFDDDCFFAT